MGLVKSRFLLVEVLGKGWYHFILDHNMIPSTGGFYAMLQSLISW